MCDIYNHKCDYKSCEESIDMHLADFATGQDEVNVYCRKHIPEKRNSGVVWKVMQKVGKKKSFHRIFVRSLTKNAKANWDGNHPNECDCWPVEVFGKRLRNKATMNKMLGYKWL